LHQSSIVTLCNTNFPRILKVKFFCFVLNAVFFSDWWIIGGVQVQNHTIPFLHNIYIIVYIYRYNINITYRLIHGHFHIGLVVIPRPILALDAFPYWSSYQPIWKCPCIKLFITYFRHLEKRRPYWPETKSRPILARANMGLDMEMIF
jgi:hypothetical protein